MANRVAERERDVNAAILRSMAPGAALHDPFVVPLIALLDEPMTAVDLAIAASGDGLDIAPERAAGLLERAVDLGLAAATRVVGRSLDGNDQRRIAEEVVGGLAGASAGGGTGMGRKGR